MESLVGMLPMLAICYLIFWVMVIRPQESKVKKHKQLLESLKRGDSVVTTGGIIGRVSSVEKDSVMVEIAPNVKVKFSQSHIVGLEKGDAKAEAA
jgi:preprotein translocase subunit YajC